MRLLIATVAFVITGLAAGFGITALEFNGVQERLRVHTSSQPADDPTDLERKIGLPRLVVINDAEYDFGQLSHNETRTHTFQIRNDGWAQLHIEYHSVSCGKCVETDFSSAELTPDRVIEVPVRFATKKLGEDFSEYVELFTNDPDIPVLRLSIVGKVTKEIQLSKDELNLANITSGQSLRTSFEIYAHQSDSLKLVDFEMSEELTAEHFDVQASPLDVSQVDRDPTPKSALTVSIYVKPGLPIGPLNQTLRLTLDAGEETSVELPLKANVVSDVSVVGGRNFRPERNVLVLGTVDKEQGTKQLLRLLVKGPERENIKIHVDSIDPAGVLQARVGEIQKINEGAVHMYPLEIEIAPGHPPVNRLGHDQGEVAKILIGTSHPDAARVVVYVSFATE